MCRRVLSVVIGVPILAAAAVLLWVAWGPQASEARTTGGMLFSQAEVAQASLSGETTLGVMVDTQAGSQAIPMPVEIGMAAEADLAIVDVAEMEAAPETLATIDMVPAEVAFTTDVVLDETVGVEVAPLPVEAVGAAPDGQGGMGGGTGGYEQRVVELEWPSQFRVGRGGAVRIKLKMLDGGALQPVAEIADNEVLATPILIADRYATHNAFVTAIIAAPDFAINTVQNPTQPLYPGDEVEWRWTLESNSAQKSVISLGLELSWEPKPGQPPGPMHVPIWGQTVQVEVNYVFGLITVPQASIAGTTLGVLGFIAEVPFLEAILEAVWNVFFGGRRRRRRREERRRR